MRLESLWGDSQAPSLLPHRLCPPQVGHAPSGVLSPPLPVAVAPGAGTPGLGECHSFLRCTSRVRKQLEDQSSAPPHTLGSPEEDGSHRRWGRPRGAIPSPGHRSREGRSAGNEQPSVGWGSPELPAPWQPPEGLSRCPGNTAGSGEVRAGEGLSPRGFGSAWLEAAVAPWKGARPARPGWVFPPASPPPRSDLEPRPPSLGLGGFRPHQGCEGLWLSSPPPLSLSFGRQAPGNLLPSHPLPRRHVSLHRPTRLTVGALHGEAPIWPVGLGLAGLLSINPSLWSDGSSRASQ